MSVSHMSIWKSFEELACNESETSTSMNVTVVSMNVSKTIHMNSISRKKKSSQRHEYIFELGYTLSVWIISHCVLPCLQNSPIRKHKQTNLHHQHVET